MERDLHRPQTVTVITRRSKERRSTEEKVSLWRRLVTSVQTVLRRRGQRCLLEESQM